MEKLLLISVLSLGVLSVSCGPQPNRPEPRYAGDYGNGNAVQNSNDAEIGQLSGFFNALVGELQNAPQLAQGPQAKKQGNGDPFLPSAVADSQPIGGAITASPAVTDAPPDDTVTPDMRNKPLTNNINRFQGPSNNGPSFENFNPPSPNFQGPNFDMPQQGSGSMYMPPPGMANPFGPGPFGQQGPGYGNGYGGDGYGYDQGPPVTHKPVGNPNSYGADNSQLQEMGIGQLGQFFSAMVGELQNSGFNNDARTAIAAKKPVAKLTTTTSATTTTTSTTTTSTDKDE